MDEIIALEKYKELWDNMILLCNLIEKNPHKAGHITIESPDGHKYTLSVIHPDTLKKLQDFVRDFLGKPL